MISVFKSARAAVASQPAIPAWRLSMILLTEEQRGQMLAHGAARARGETIDPWPVVKLYTLDAGAAWLLVALDADGDKAYGLCDAGRNAGMAS